MRIYIDPQYKYTARYYGEVVLSRCDRVLEAAAAILPTAWLGGRCHSNFYPGGSQDLLFGRLPAGMSYQSETGREDALYNSLGRMAEYCTEMVSVL